VDNSATPIKNNQSGGIVSSVFNGCDGFKNMGLNNIPSYTLSGLNYNHVLNKYESKFDTPEIKNVSVNIDNPDATDGPLTISNNIPSSANIPYITNSTFGDNFLNDYSSPKLYGNNNEDEKTLDTIEDFSD
jgi:hypothetical protein